MNPALRKFRLPRLLPTPVLPAPRTPPQRPSPPPSRTNSKYENKPENLSWPKKTERNERKERGKLLSWKQLQSRSKIWPFCCNIGIMNHCDSISSKAFDVRVSFLFDAADGFCGGKSKRQREQLWRLRNWVWFLANLGLTTSSIKQATLLVKLLYGSLFEPLCRVL